MPALSSAWLVGSIGLTLQAPTIDATPISLAAATYYGRHTTAVRSLIDTLATAIVAAVGGTCTVVVTRSRRILITFNVARSITWGAYTQLRDLLGFTGDRGAASTQLAENVSPLLWSPGYLATPKTIAGVDGYTIDHKATYESDDGQQSYTYYYSTETWQDLEWMHIDPSRMRVSTGTGGGTFHEFYEQVAKLGARFFYYENVVEDDTDTATGVTWTTGRGPYRLRPEFDGDWYRRNVAFAEVSSPLALPLHKLAEYP
jgi:hypothetical protein